MELLLGIDGGGTKTTFILTDIDGNLISSTTLGPSSIDTVSNEVTYKTLSNGVKEVTSGLSDFKIISVFAGLGGIISNDDINLVVNMLHNIDLLKDAKISANSDIYNAYKAGLKNDFGIAIIIGTGIVAFTVDKNTNEPIRVGGYTYKEGDYGSSYDVGKRALNLVSKVFDFRVELSPLVKEIMDKYNIVSFNDVKLLLERLYDERTEVAQLARLVTKYAELGDKHAIRIIDEATDEAVLHINAILKRVKLDNYELSITGSLGNADTLYKKLFYKKVVEINPNFDIHANILNAGLGSIVIAMENAGINPASKRDNLLKINL